MGQLAQGRIQGLAITHGLLVTAVLMVVPILMVVASVTLPDRVNRRANLVAATGLFLVDLVGLPSYTSASASFLIVVGLALNALTVWYAWRWR
jgi:hypothetical protein